MASALFRFRGDILFFDHEYFHIGDAMRGMKRRLTTVLAVVLALALLTGVVLLIQVCAAARRTYPAARADCIVVLGAHVWMSGEMCETLTLRCERALDAWREGVAPVLILCGRKGVDEPRPEAEAMRDWLMERGVPEAAMLLDIESANTEQNLRAAKNIMNRHGFKTAAICTSDYHLTRALWLARDLGIEASALSAPTPGTWTSLVRSRLRETCSWALYAVRKAVRK